MENNTLIYLAGPYSSEPDFQTHRAVKIADQLWKKGYIVFVPHLSHFWGKICPHTYEEWMEYDFEILSRCDLLVRIPGESKGADREWNFAKLNNIPVFTLEEFLSV